MIFAQINYHYDGGKMTLNSVIVLYYKSFLESFCFYSLSGLLGWSHGFLFYSVGLIHYYCLMQKSTVS